MFKRLFSAGARGIGTATALVTLGLVMLSPAAALACSSEEGFDTPNNYELLDRSDLVVVARVGDQLSGEEGFGNRVLALEPVKVLKGQLPDGGLWLPGEFDWNGEPVEPIITPLGENHFSAGLGACIRLFYQPGELVLLALEDTARMARDAGSDEVYASDLPRFLPLGDPSARSIETVANLDDIWVEAATLYLAVAANPADKVRQLTSARDTLRARGDIAGNAIANDIDWILNEDEIGSYWDSFNLPNASLAFLRNPAANAQVTLVCEANEPAVRLIAPHGASFALLVGDTPFALADASDLAVPKPFGDEDNAQAILKSSEIVDADSLLRRLTMGHETTGIRIDGVEFARAAPGDILHRWAQRCGDFAEAGRASGSPID